MTTTERTARPLRSDSLFFPLMALAMIAVVFAGFSPTFYLKNYFHTPVLTPLRIVHGIAFTSWMVLLIVQTGLIAANKRLVHRRLGILGAGIALAMVGLGSALAVSALRDGHAPDGAPSAAAFFAVPIFSIWTFGALVVIGVTMRKRMDFHKRLMIIATVAILPAAVARIQTPIITHGGPPAFFGLTDLFIFFCAVYDYYKLRRVHRATLWGGIAVIVSQIVSLVIGMVPLWTSFAGLFTN